MAGARHQHLYPPRRIVYTASAKGVPFRINSTFRGDRANDAATTRWSYFKITN